MQRLLRALQTAYADRGIAVTTSLDEQVIIRGDERDVMEIVGNLLENAFKYTRTGVRVGLTRSANQRDRAKIAIEDDGDGIPAELREEVLRRGRRLDEMQSGQGIGLAVVAELVELHQGNLEITDSELGGACITVTLG